MLRFALLLLLLLTAPASVLGAKPDHARSWQLYKTRVAGILKKKCAKCHSAKNQKAGLDLTNPQGILRGSESGSVITAGKLDESSLWEMITNGEMPPQGEVQLTPDEKKVIRQWIESGASTSQRATVTTISEHQIIPLMLLRCSTCHGPRKKEGGLDLSSRAGMLKGGKSGPAVVPGQPEKSLLIQRIKKEEMPPRRLLVAVSVKTMKPHELKMLEAWIRQGMPSANPRPQAKQEVTNADRKFWAFQPPHFVLPPRVKAAINNPIDAFLLHRLQEKGLGFSQPADRRTMIRRLTFSLLGLPPSPGEVALFLADKSPLAYERLVDRLLASPRYGERWGRRWLDVAGYADSEGGQNGDMFRPNMYRYRDYVIRAWNSDKPYDRFIQEQIAGDELADYQSAKVITQALYDNLVATGFLRTAPDRTFANITNFVPDRLEVIADEMQILGTAVLGLTVQCARCHSHKFDPIPQSDYYRLTAVFKGALDEHDWLKSQGPRTLTSVTSVERQKWERTEKRITDESKQIEAKLKGEKSAAKKQALAARLAALKGQRKPQPRIRALWARGIPSPTYVLKRGSYLTPGRPVDPDVPQVLSAAGMKPYKVQAPWKGAKKTGRRLAFAKWLTQPGHPLTSRVMVNRVWKLHFGRGIVRTLSNFGKAGARPTHPRLLDWLALEFERNGWSLKRLHRLVLTSRAFRQTSHVSQHSKKLDPQGIWLSRMPMKRMEAEVVRDSLLSVAGELSHRPFGPADTVAVRGDGLVTTVRPSTGWRRSVFVRQRRTEIPTLLENFDMPQMAPNCIKRDESLVSPQALQLLNSKLVHTLAESFAKRITREVGPNRRRQIDRAVALALGRDLEELERKAIQDSLARMESRWLADISKGKSVRDAHRRQAAEKALVNFCHAIMNSAAFIYVD